MNNVIAMVFLIGANGAPIIAEKLFGRQFGIPIDGGLRLGDGRPLFGRSKTVRGVGFAVLLCLAIAWFFKQPLWIGMMFGLYAMLGDLCSSFIKRRVGIPVSGRALGLDQIPESLFPLWMLQSELGIGKGEVIVLVVAFFVVELTLSKWLYRWHIRKRPY